MNEYRRLPPNDIYEIESRCNEDTAKQIKRIFRDEPQGILAAYDTYKTEIPLKNFLSENVAADELEEVLAWKQDLLDLKTEAFVNIPEKVAYYYTKYKR